MYAMQPNANIDLSWLGSMCLGGLVTLLVSSVLRFFFGFSPNDVLVSALGALTFAGYIVYDTKRITDGSHPEHSLQSHQYILGALELYLDVISLFIYLLRLFGERERE